MVIIIKPYSLIVLIFFLMIYKKKLIVDINDPLDRKEFLGRFKFLLMVKLFNGKLIFESIEFKNYCENKYGAIGYLIDDYSQVEDFIPTPWSDRSNYVLWFGNSGNSDTLLRAVELLHYLNSLGYKLLINGLREDVSQDLQKLGIDFISISTQTRSEYLGLLSTSKFAIIPFDKEDPIHAYRGNLKIKIAMGAGCVVFGEEMEMHNRIVKFGENGFLFNSDNQNPFINLLKKNNINFQKISDNATKSIKNIGLKEDYKNKYHSLATNFE